MCLGDNRHGILDTRIRRCLLTVTLPLWLLHVMDFRVPSTFGSGIQSPMSDLVIDVVRIRRIG